MTREEFDAFCKQHGPAVKSNNWLYWADGHYMEDMGGAQPREPTTDRQRCENQIVFFETKLDRTTKAFDDLKYQANAMAHRGQLHGIRKEETLAQLNALKEEVAGYKARLVEVEEERLKHLPLAVKRRLNPPEPDEETIKEIESIEI